MTNARKGIVEHVNLRFRRQSSLISQTLTRRILLLLLRTSCFPERDGCGLDTDDESSEKI